VRLGRARFGDLISRQLDLFAEDDDGLIADADRLKREYDRAPREDAEEAYGDYMDAVETATEALADMRDRFAQTLDDAAGEEYEVEFNNAVRRRWPPFGLEIENR
jgi:hypothetical protein